MRINTNIASLNAQTNGTNTNLKLSSSLEKLSSGLKINRAADDASGMAIADKLRTQASSIGQGISNANSGSALIQIADAAMGEQSNILDIVKTKLIQAATSTTSAEGREAVRKDVAKLLEQLDNISSQTNYNGVNLLNEKDTDFSFQVGEDSSFDIGLTTAYAVNTNGLGSGQQVANNEDSYISYAAGVSIGDVGSQLSVQFDKDTAVAAGSDKAVNIGQGTAGTAAGLVAIDIASDNVSAIGFTKGAGNGSMTTDDSALKAALDDFAAANTASLKKMAEGQYEILTGQTFVIEFASNIDISDLSISGLSMGSTATDMVSVMSDDMVSVTKTDGFADVQLQAGTYAGLPTAIAAVTATALKGLASNTAEGINMDTAGGAKTVIEEGTVGVQVDPKLASAYTAQSGVEIVNNDSVGSPDEVIYTVNADNVSAIHLELPTQTAATGGASSITLSTGDASTIAKLDEIAGSNASLTKLTSGAYTFEISTTTATASARVASLSFGGEFDVKDLTISGQDVTEDVRIITDGAVNVTKNGTTEDDTDIALSAVSMDGSTLASTTAGKALIGASSDIMSVSESLAGLMGLSADGLTSDVANTYMSIVDNAMTQLNSVRSDFGSTQNQLSVATRNMMTTQVNIKAAESIIRDVDYAAESANFNKQNIIAQAGTYAMSQANAMQQNVLRLLQ